MILPKFWKLGGPIASSASPGRYGYASVFPFCIKKVKTRAFLYKLKGMTTRGKWQKNNTKSLFIWEFITVFKNLDLFI